MKKTKTFLLTFLLGAFQSLSLQALVPSLTGATYVCSKDNVETVVDIDSRLDETTYIGTVYYSDSSTCSLKSRVTILATQEEANRWMLLVQLAEDKWVGSVFDMQNIILSSLSGDDLSADNTSCTLEYAF